VSFQTDPGGTSTQAPGDRYVDAAKEAAGQEPTAPLDPDDLLDRIEEEGLGQEEIDPWLWAQGRSQYPGSARTWTGSQWWTINQSLTYLAYASPNDVTALQQRLYRAGYYPGEVYSPSNTTVPILWGNPRDPATMIAFQQFLQDSVLHNQPLYEAAYRQAVPSPFVPDKPPGGYTVPEGALPQVGPRPPRPKRPWGKKKPTDEEQKAYDAEVAAWKLGNTRPRTDAQIKGWDQMFAEREAAFAPQLAEIEAERARARLRSAGVDTEIVLTDPDDIVETTRELAPELIGRRLTTEEEQVFVTAYQGIEAARQRTRIERGLAMAQSGEINTDVMTSLRPPTVSAFTASELERTHPHETRMARVGTRQQAFFDLLTSASPGGRVRRTG